MFTGSDLLGAAALAGCGLTALWQLLYDLSGSGLTFVMCPIIDSMNHRSCGEGGEEVRGHWDRGVYSSGRCSQYEDWLIR